MGRWIHDPVLRTEVWAWARNINLRIIFVRMFLLDEITYGENVEKRRESKIQSWVITTFLSWEEEGNESAKRRKRGQRGGRKFWGVKSPRSQGKERISRREQLLGQCH